MIDIFTKYVVVVPIASKGEGDIASGMMEALKKLNGKPELLYTDDETASKLSSYTRLSERTRHSTSQD